MKVQGLPESFWVVTEATSHSTLGDICFRCDFAQFAQQVRGGLDETTIIAIFAEESEAQNEAKRLLALLNQAEK